MTGPRVLHVLDHSLPHLSGYSVRSHYILRAQRRDGVEPLVLTSPKHGSSAADEHIDGVTYQRVPADGAGVNGSVPGIHEAQLMLRLAKRLGQLARQHSVEVIHAHSPVLNGLPALWTGRRMGLPVVYEIRALWEDAAVAYRRRRNASVRYRVIRAIETWLLHQVDAVGVISAGLGREVIDRGIPAQKVYLVPNGVDPERFQPLQRDDDLARQLGLDGKLVIGFIGTLYSYEGLDVLLQAMAQLASRAPALCAVLIGEGPESARLRDQARRLGIASRVKLAGAIPHSDIRRWYSVCDILVYPRRSTRLTELTTPLKPLEAMAMGKAIVASDVGGLRELVRDGDTGVLFCAGAADAFAGVLENLSHDDELRATLADRPDASCAHSAIGSTRPEPPSSCIENS